MQMHIGLFTFAILRLFMSLTDVFFSFSFSCPSMRRYISRSSTSNFDTCVCMYAKLVCIYV